MKKPFFFFLCSLFSLLGMWSCSETDDTKVEYPDWQNTNEAYYSTLYTTTRDKITQGDKSWKIIKCFSMPEETEYYTASPEEYIIVNVLEEGTGPGCPLYTDSVRVHYTGHLLPSVTYTDGYIFDKSYYGTFDEKTAAPVSMLVSGVVDGFSTALQNMHCGDKWRVYIPYQLGYGASSSSSSIPDYSTLIFEIQLVSYHRPGAEAIPFK